MDCDLYALDCRDQGCEFDPHDCPRVRFLRAEQGAAVNLEEHIRRLAAKGELTHLSVIPSAGGWSATYAAATSFGRTHAQHTDPVEALLAVLNQKENGPRKKPEPAAPAATAVNPWD